MHNDDQNQELFFNNNQQNRENGEENNKAGHSSVWLSEELQKRYGQFNNGSNSESKEDGRGPAEDYQELDLNSPDEEEILTESEPKEGPSDFFTVSEAEEERESQVGAGEEIESLSDQVEKRMEELEAKEDPETSAEKEEKGIYLSPQKIALIKRFLGNIKDNNDKLLALFKDWDREFENRSEGIPDNPQKQNTKESEGEIIEGVFDGENMIGPDGHQYTVPANYASKSKLVEGDILKLTILPDGTFMYKQISPIARERVTGTLKETEEGNYYVVSGEKRWRVLLSSVTYFKGESGDEVVLLIPQEEGSKWGAIENIIKNK